jgi:hypothetical protein
VVAGKYLGAGATRLQFSLDRSTNDTEQAFTICIAGCFNGIASVDLTTDEIRFDVMHVRSFRAASYALSGGVSDASSDGAGTVVFLPNPVLPPFPNQTLTLNLDGVSTYFVAAELFPIPQLGVRLGYTRLDGDSASGHVVDVEASWYFRRNFGIELTLSRDDTNDVSTDGVALRVIGRF